MCNSVAVMHANVCVLFETDALTDFNSCTKFRLLNIRCENFLILTLCFGKNCKNIIYMFSNRGYIFCICYVLYQTTKKRNFYWSARFLCSMIRKKEDENICIGLNINSSCSFEYEQNLYCCVHVM